MSTIIGILLGMAAVIFAIIDTSTQQAHTITSFKDIYLNLPAFFLVFGGTMAATLIAHPIQHLVHATLGFFKIFFKTPFDMTKGIDVICDFSEAYNKRGVSGLEDKLQDHPYDNLFKKGVMMTINGHKPDAVMEFMDISMSRLYDREMIDHYVFKTMGKTAPAFGMVGTLVGLIFMMNIMGKDPSKIGPFLAIALVATFYGLVFTNLFFNPMGNKLLHAAEFNLRIRRMEKDGLWLLLQKQHPVFIKDQLLSYITSQPKKPINNRKK